MNYNLKKIEEQFNISPDEIERPEVVLDTPNTTETPKVNDPLPTLDFAGKGVRDAALHLVRDPRFLVPAGVAALGAGTLFRTGQRLANVPFPDRDEEDKKRSGLRNTLGTLAGLGLTGAGAYGAYKLMNRPKTVNESRSNPYSAAFKPSSILGGTLGTAAAIGSFPLADAITSGMKEGPLKTITNIGAKALLSTVGTAAAGYAGYKAGEEIENAQRRAEEASEKRRQEQNPYLPKFYDYDYA